MVKGKRAKQKLPLWGGWLAGILAVWVALSGITYALSGETTLDASIDDITIRAEWPMTYAQKVNGEELVFDENGEAVYVEDKVTEEDAPKCVGWSFDSEASTLHGEICALYDEGCRKDMQSVKATLEFTNTNATDDMILSFTYSYTTAEGNGKLTGLVSGGSASESGTVTVTIAHGASESIVLYSGSSSEEEQEGYGKVTLDLSNITVTNVNQTYSATLRPATYGTYQASFTDAEGTTRTYVVTNQAVTSELTAAYPNATVVAASQPVTYRLSDRLTLTALDANSGFRFDHWQAGTMNLGADSPATLIPADGAEVTATFLQESYINAFTVGNQVYYSWNQAVGEALTSGNPIILNQNYTFPATMADAAAAGEVSGSYVTENESGRLVYTLPANVKFVVPKSEGDYGNFSNVLPVGVLPSTPTTHFRTLTVPAGVTLQINGEISVNGDYYCKQPYETVAHGPHGLVSLNEGAKINVSNGGKIWCYGFIAGAGEVEIASGGHAAEFLQITDWGGGSAALDWAMNTKNMYNAFYFSQYYVQNIEAKMTVYAGATTEVAVAIVASGQVAASRAAFIGEGGLFHLMTADGHITRTYDASTDRTNYNVYGDMETSGITVSIMNYKLASGGYVLGINGNLSLNIESGKTTLLNDFMLLPGTEVNVAEGAAVEVAQTAELSHINMETGELETETRPVRMFIIDDYEWNNTIDKDPMVQLKNLYNGNANYSYPRKQSTLPYTIANGENNGDIRGNVTAKSATVNVDGTLKAYSNIFTTNYIGYLYDTMTEMLSDPDTRAAYENQMGAAALAGIEAMVTEAYNASKDKLVTGTGTIINEPAVENIDSSLNLLTQTGSVKNQVTIPTAGMLGALNEDGTYAEFGTGTYQTYLDENGKRIWYKNQVTYHFTVIDPATRQSAGTLPDQSFRTAEDYHVLTAEDLTVNGQRYAIFGFDASTVQTGAMGGIPIGFVPEDGVIINDGNFNLSGNSQNRNFATPASWNELMGDAQDLMTYVMSNGITSGWDTIGFVFADLSKMSSSMADMLCGGLTSEITLYVVPYDYYVAWGNSTTGERAQSYLPSGVSTAQYTIDGEAIISQTITAPATGDTVAITTEQSVDENEHTTTLSLEGINQDLLVSMTASYTRARLTWKFVDADNDSVVYDTIETIQDTTLSAVSPLTTEIDNEAHRYYVIHGDLHTKVADRYPNVGGVVALSNDEAATGTASLTGVTLNGITEPVTIFVKVDAYEYKLSFTTDEEKASVEDFYVKGGDSLALTVSDIALAGDEKFCYDDAAVTGTATATITNNGAELAITEIGSDATITLKLRGYDYLVTFINYNNSTKVGYSFVTSGKDAVYTYGEGEYSYGYTKKFNDGEAAGTNLAYTPAWENQRAKLTVSNVTADRTVDVQKGTYDRALAVRGESNAIKWLVYTSYSYQVGPYNLGANKYMTGATNPNGATIVEGANPSSISFQLPNAGYYNVTFQTSTYAHVINVNFFEGGSAKGTQLNDGNWRQLTLRILTDEEGGTATLTTAQFRTLIGSLGCKSTQIANAGDRLFFYLRDYSETGSGANSTFTPSPDGKTLTISDVYKDATVNVMVIPYANTVTVTDTGLNTTKLHYVDANGKDITNSYNFTGTNFVTYSAGSNRGIFAVSGLTNADINHTADEIAAGVDSIIVSNITGDASLTVDTHSTKHKLTIEYVEPWGSTTETVYPDGDVYTASFDDRSIVQATVTTEDGSTASNTSNSFTVTMPDAVTTTKVVVEFRYTATRLKYDPSDSDNSNIINSTRGNAEISVTDSYYGQFTVTCEKACFVAIDDGENYTQLTAVPTGEANQYQFSCPDNFSDTISIVVVVKGDANLNGSVDNVDFAQVQALALNKVTFTLPRINFLAADVNKNGILDNVDFAQIKAVALGRVPNFPW